MKTSKLKKPITFGEFNIKWTALLMEALILEGTKGMRSTLYDYDRAYDEWKKEWESYQTALKQSN